MHTPGPWSVGREGDGMPGYVYCGNELGSAVAICYGKALPYSVFKREEEIANAALIAAAPDLLDALRDLKALVRDGYQHNDIAMTRSLAQAQAALDKALCR